MTAQESLPLTGAVDPAAWNPYWLAFARAHGRHPAEKRRGLACDFIIWMSQRWQEWRRANMRAEFQRLAPEDHAAFARELAERYPSTEIAAPCATDPGAPRCGS